MDTVFFLAVAALTSLGLGDIAKLRAEKHEIPSLRRIGSALRILGLLTAGAAMATVFHLSQLKGYDAQVHQLSNSVRTWDSLPSMDRCPALKTAVEYYSEHTKDRPRSEYVVAAEATQHARELPCTAPSTE